MSEINTCIVFGATGKTGIQLLHRGILEGHEVTAFVRNPKKIPEDISSKLHRVIQGDVLNKTRVEDAIEGHDVVLSAIGTGQNFGPTTLISESCKNIIAAMKKHGVRKLAVVSMAQVLPQEKPYFLSKEIIKDHRLQIELLKEASDEIDWIAMMAPTITNNPHVHPRYRVETNKIPGKHAVTTGELADFMVKVFMDRPSTDQFRHCMLGISSEPKISLKEFKIPALSVLIVAGAFVVLYYRLLPVVLQEFLDEVFK